MSRQRLQQFDLISNAELINRVRDFRHCAHTDI